jgi:hypothetical protein
MNSSDLIYDWNKNYPPGLKPPGLVLLNDESLRDGLQSPSVRDPSIAEKIEILHLMEALGIDSLDLGLPGAGARAVEAVTALAREVVAHKMKIRANCAARTLENDIRPIAEIVEKTGLRIEAATFIGSSPIRRFTEGWSDDFLLHTTEKAIKYAVTLGLDVMYDATVGIDVVLVCRSPPGCRYLIDFRLCRLALRDQVDMLGMLPPEAAQHRMISRKPAHLHASCQRAAPALGIDPLRVPLRAWRNGGNTPLPATVLVRRPPLKPKHDP